MITVVSKRKDVATDNPLAGFSESYQTTTERALISLVKYELAYGGNIEDISENNGIFSVITITRVLNKIDTMIFSGSKEEMQPLLMVCGAVIVIQTN